MKAFKCDRCGKFYGAVDELKNTSIRVKYYDEEWKDLCPDCTEKIIKFLEMEEHEEKTDEQI